MFPFETVYRIGGYEVSIKQEKETPHLIFMDVKASLGMSIIKRWVVNTSCGLWKIPLLNFFKSEEGTWVSNIEAASEKACAYADKLAGLSVASEEIIKGRLGELKLREQVAQELLAIGVR